MVECHNLLPDINAAALDGTGSLPGTIHHSHRLREIAVQSIVEGTSRARIQRALRTPTLPAAQLTLHPGDTVDFYREPTQKDLPGWSGPATITDKSNVTRGMITVTHNGREIISSPKDLRQRLEYLCFLAAPHVTNHVGRAFSVIRNAIEHLRPNMLMTLGYVLSRGKWVLAESTRANTTVWNAAKHIASTMPDVGSITAARQGKECSALSPIPGYAYAMMITWPCNHPDHTIYHWTAPLCVLNFRQSYSTQWESIRWIQFLIAEDTGLHKHQSSEACSAEERGEPGHQLSATTEDEPMLLIGRVEPIPQVLETI